MSIFQSKYLGSGIELIKAERRVIRRQAWRLWRSQPGSFLISFVLGAGGVIVTVLGTHFFKEQATGLGRGAIAVSVMAFLIAYLVGVVVLERHLYSPYVPRVMREHGYDVCLKCGYWLKGLDDEIKRCPECGTAREPFPPSGSA